MKKILIPLLLMFCAGLFAQDMDLLYNLRHSSRDANGFVHLRFDGVEEMGDINHEAYYGMNGSWQQTAVNPL
ncbi:MAG TPA: T9SS C-terminal target domain-containing protein, partial [Candidatus Cloacimonadota bacterium]|nr:T9SS C-terminal target domain-containing protein [Candidatus Cloacimonadota bacterium]